MIYIIFLGKCLGFSLDNYNKIFRWVDLSYGGAVRSGKGEKDLIKYYFGYEKI